MLEKEKKIGDVLKTMVDSMNWKEKLHETAIREAWKEKMGTTINAHTKEIRFRNGKLYLNIDSSSLRQEMTYEREKIKDMLNLELGEQAVSEVVVR